MIKAVDFYYFSPTGGTKKCGAILAESLAEKVNYIELAKDFAEGSCDVAVIAAPVFGGRIPGVVAEKVKTLSGSGKRVVTMAVYGVRAYEDALIELNDCAGEAGFEVIAGAAVIAQHSVVPIVGAGRPDGKDTWEIKAFAADVLKKLDKKENAAVSVPGNRPYKQGMNLPASPMSAPECVACAACVKACPVEAVKLEENEVVTDAEKCMLCLYCVPVCPVGARMLPPPLQAMMTEKLSPLKDVRRENEFYV